MKNIKHILIITLVVLLSACSKDDDTQIVSKDDYDIHVVGNVTNEKTNFSRAMYWKNNVSTLLEKSDEISAATAVVVVNNDVYVSGSVNGKACYWKNGKIIYLPNGTQSYDIKVVGTDVYVAGEDNYVACYWKNGIKTSLAEPQNESIAYAIEVVGNDVYVAGTHSLGKNSYKFLAFYWKNNVPVVLDDFQGYAFDIAVTANDVYVAGDAYKNSFVNNTYFVYWKNNIEVYTTLEKKDQNKIYTNRLAIDNNDVFATGYIHSYGIREASYWKNGKGILLANASNPSHSEAKDIEVQDNFVFVCGYEKLSTVSNSRPKIWINNEEVFLTGDIKSGEALGIFVVKKKLIQ